MISSSAPLLVLGVGTRLLGADAAGPLAIDRLRARGPWGVRARFVDAGTIRLSLLPQIEQSAGLIAIDAAALGKTLPQCRALVAVRP
ncbi:MAG TPA: hypothetical protein VED47_08150 [Burkholderiaceae bacterium]|nr:hypothetical protein [Burkholderiaceae bacterium]